MNQLGHAGMIVCNDRMNNNTVISGKSKHFLRVEFFGIIHAEVSNFSAGESKIFLEQR
jgi:hypothetical protein